MKFIFLILASVITITGTIPYLIDILKGKTKPNLVSWITWTLLTGIATSAAISAGEHVAAIFTGAATIEVGLVVVLGLIKKSYVEYSRFDIFCQVGAVVGIILWQLFDSPAIGVLSSVVIDFIGALPTIKHSWLMPSEETWQSFALSGIGGVFGILALESLNLVSLPYALYIVVINILIATIILYRRSLPSPVNKTNKNS